MWKRELLTCGSVAFRLTGCTYSSDVALAVLYAIDHCTLSDQTVAGASFDSTTSVESHESLNLPRRICSEWEWELFYRGGNQCMILFIKILVLGITEGAAETKVGGQGQRMCIRLLHSHSFIKCQSWIKTPKKDRDISIIMAELTPA